MSAGAPPAPHANHTDQPQTMRTPAGTPFTLAPRDSGITLHGWQISRFSGAISSSAALDAFQADSHIHCPEMTFLENHLTLRHEASGVEIKLEAKEALKACATQPTAEAPIHKPTPDTAHTGRPTGTHANVDTARPSAHPSAHPAGGASAAAAASSSSSSVAAPVRLQVAAASKWNTKSYDGLVEGGVKQVDHGFDWTYTTKYKGQVVSTRGGPSDVSSLIAPTTAELPLAMLQRPDPILWYDTLPLFEDELHDNGVASLTVRIRVMDSCFFVLMQFWLRVDDTIVRVYDTRIFHAFGDDHLIREQTCREDTFDELQKRGMPRTASLYVDPNVIGRKLTLKSTEREKISLPPPFAAAAVAPAPAAS